jgi:hypothetical protein
VTVTEVTDPTVKHQVVMALAAEKPEVQGALAGQGRHAERRLAAWSRGKRLNVPCSWQIPSGELRTL